MSSCYCIIVVFYPVYRVSLSMVLNEAPTAQRKDLNSSKSWIVSGYKCRNIIWSGFSFGTPTCFANRLSLCRACRISSTGLGLKSLHSSEEKTEGGGARGIPRKGLQISRCCSPRPATSFYRKWRLRTNGWMKRIRVWNFISFFFLSEGTRVRKGSAHSRWCSREQTGSSAANRRQCQTHRGAPRWSASQRNTAHGALECSLNRLVICFARVEP